MADSDEIFLAAGLDEVLGRVELALGLNGGREMEGGEGERGYVGHARAVEAPMGIFVGPTIFPPEPGELQAMDAYPVMVDVQFRTHKPLQAEEARLAFEAIVPTYRLCCCTTSPGWLPPTYLVSRSTTSSRG